MTAAAGQRNNNSNIGPKSDDAEYVARRRQSHFCTRFTTTCRPASINRSTSWYYKETRERPIDICRRSSWLRRPANGSCRTRFENSFHRNFSFRIIRANMQVAVYVNQDKVSALHTNVVFPVKGRAANEARQLLSNQTTTGE